MTRPAPRSTESLPIVHAGVNALPALAGAQLAVATVTAAALMVVAADHGDEIVGVWMGSWLVWGLPQTLGLAWLAARLDRRLSQLPPVARWLWLPFGALVTTLTWWLPMLALTPVQFVMWLVEDRGRYLDGAVVGLLAWAIVFVVGVVAVLMWRAVKSRPSSRRPRRVSWADVVPTGGVGLLWAMPLLALPAGWLIAALGEASAAMGIAALLAWAALPAVGLAYAGRWLPVPSQARLEVAGLLLVALALPLFVAGLLPSWGRHHDAHWISLGASFVVALVGTGLAAHGRGERHDAVA